MDDAVELEVQKRIFHDHGRRMMDLFKRMTNLYMSQIKIVTPPSKTVEETIYLSVYNSGLQLIRSRTRITDESVDQAKVETVDSGVSKHLLEQVPELQTDVEVIIGELIPIRHQDKPLPEAIGLYKVLRKLKFTLTQMISKHYKLMELMETVKMMILHVIQIILVPQRLLASSCLNSAFPNLMETFLIGEHFGSSSRSRYMHRAAVRC